MLRCIAPHELSDDLAADRRPYVIDAVRFAHLFSIVQWRWAVAIGDDIYMVRREDLESSFKRWTYDTGGLIARLDKVSSISCVKMTQQHQRRPRQLS